MSEAANLEVETLSAKENRENPLLNTIKVPNNLS